MAVSLCELIEFCHCCNIILCDINKNNVLFSDDLTAYLVDIDSAQIYDELYCYPSSVGVPEYLAPERYGTPDFSFIRNKSDDTWILQTLLFSIVTSCAGPYNIINYEEATDYADAAKQGLYPFQAGSFPAADFVLKSEKLATWYNIISYLHYKTKLAFRNAFHRDGENYRSSTRMSAYQWLTTMVEYRVSLPEMTAADLQSNSYTPNVPQPDSAPSQQAEPIRHESRKPVPETAKNKSLDSGVIKQ